MGPLVGIKECTSFAEQNIIINNETDKEKYVNKLIDNVTNIISSDTICIVICNRNKNMNFINKCSDTEDKRREG